jgi:hypothetical protein
VGEPELEPVCHLVLGRGRRSSTQTSSRSSTTPSAGARDARALYDEGLVQPDIFTIDNEGVAGLRHRQPTPTLVVHVYDQKVFNDPNLSQLAGDCVNAIMPGATRSTSLDRTLSDGKEPVDIDRVWN